MVKGPMGKALGFKNSGLHVAFCQGSGVLPFVDLAALLIRFNLKMLHESERNFID